MAATNDLLNPTKFDAYSNSLKRAKQLKNWLKTFTNFLERCKETTTAQEVRAPDRLQLLFAYVSADVYECIEDYETEAAATEKLKSIYIKTQNVIRIC